MLLTFSLTVFTWIFFRAENIGHAFSYISEILSPSLFSLPYYPGIGLTVPTIILTFLFVLIEWQGREGQYAIENLGIKWNQPLRYAIYYAIIITLFWFGGKEQQFIYFQF
jgi:alginate O-acetyltransferase complex protein AlgI